MKLRFRPDPSGHLAETVRFRQCRSGYVRCLPSSRDIGNRFIKCRIGEACHLALQGLAISFSRHCAIVNCWWSPTLNAGTAEINSIIDRPNTNVIKRFDCFIHPPFFNNLLVTYLQPSVPDLPSVYRSLIVPEKQLSSHHLLSFIVFHARFQKF